MQVGSYGVFHGGNVTINTLQTGIDVTAMTVRTEDGRNLGFGAPGRKVVVQFGQLQSPFSFSATRPSPLDAPIYTLLISAQAGHAFVAFDAAVTNDITLIAEPTTGFIVLAKVSWPAGATALQQLSLSFDERQVSRLLTSYNPLDAQDLYTAGMRFGDAEFNKPLIAFSVLGEVLQGEVVARNSDEFNFVVARASDIEGSGPTLTVHPVRVLRRYLTPQGVAYTVIETKTDYTFTYDVPAIIGERIYIWVNPASGEVEAGLAYIPGAGILVAYGDVPFGATGLQVVRWVLASQTTDSNPQSGTSIVVQNMTLPSGFVRPVRVSTSALVQKYLLLHQNVAVVDGVEYNIPEQPVSFPDAPTTDGRLDLLFVELYRRVEPSPPVNGEFFQAVPGGGYIVARARLVVVPGVQYADAQVLMLQPNITGLGGGTFARAADGHFFSSYADAADGKSYALPLALVYRFNQAPFADTNLTGGAAATRPDGKQHNFIHMDEVELPGPVLRQHGLNHAAAFGRALQAILRGAHPNKLGAATQLPWYRSKRPVQLDALAGTVLAGAHMFGAPDGARRDWSAASAVYWVGANFVANLDATGPVIAFEDGTRALTLNAPSGANLFLGGAGGVQPVVQLVWVSTGQPVQLTGPWTVGADAVSAVGTVDASAATFQAAGLISVSFAATQRPEAFLSNVPSQILEVTLNGAPLNAATPGPAQNFTFNSLPAQLRPVGPVDACGAFTVNLVAVADGTSLLSVPAEIGGVAVIGVRSVVRVADDAVLGIKTVQLGGANHSVVLTAAVAAGDEARLELLMAGRVCNIIPENRAVTDFAEAVLHSTTVLGERPVYGVALPEGRVLRGVYNFVRVANSATVQGAFLDGYLYPATVTGVDRNFVQVNLTLSAADFAALPVTQQGKWQLDPVQGYYILNAGSFNLQLAILWSAALAPTDQLRILYAYASHPFAPIAGGEQFELLHRGLVIASNSSAANRSPNYFAPLAEKLPGVKGAVLGLGAADPETVFNDPVTLQSRGLLPVEGTQFGIDGSVDFGLGVGTPGAGFLAWACLVKDQRNVRVLAYVSQDNAFSISDPAKAFVTYCDANYVE
jgi:hypothetical protein